MAARKLLDVSRITALGWANDPALVLASRPLRPGTARTSSNLKMQQVTGPSFVLTALLGSDL